MFRVAHLKMSITAGPRPVRNMAALRRIALNFLTFMHQYFWSRMSICRLRKMVTRNLAQLEPIMAL